MLVTAAKRPQSSTLKLPTATQGQAQKHVVRVSSGCLVGSRRGQYPPVLVKLGAASTTGNFGWSRIFPISNGLQS